VVRARAFARNNLKAHGFLLSVARDITDHFTSIKQALRHGHFGGALTLIQEQTDAQQSRRDARAQTTAKLVALYSLPKEEKRVTLLYIPKSNRAYWDLLDISGPDLVGRPQFAWAIPFVAPALSGLALLDGLPNPEDIPIDGGYGYGFYPRVKEPRRPSDQTRDAFCRKASGMGFRRILVLDGGPDGAPLLHEWCFGGAQPILDNP
jgi:hypothetical protein